MLCLQDGNATQAYVRKQRSHNTRTRKRTKNLRNKHHSGTRPAQAADEHETEGHRRIEKAATDAEENPGVDHKTESKRESDVKQCTGGRRGAIGQCCCLVGNLSAGEGEEEEEECPEKLADCLSESQS